MALINCPECGQQMSDTAKKCPHCGFKQPSLFDWQKYKPIIGIGIIILSLIWMIISICTMSNWGSKFTVDDDMFICGAIMFIIGFVPLYFGCRMLKTLLKRTTLIFTITSLLCLVDLGCIFLTMGINTWRGWEEDSMANLPTQNASSEDPESLCTWNYATDIDNLTGETAGYKALITSTNSITANHGQDRLIIQLSYNSVTGKPTNSFGLAFEKGKCHFALYKSQGFYAVFDDGEVDNTWTLCNGGNNNSIVMVSDGFSRTEDKITSFINKLKRAKTCKIQVNIEGMGMETFTFNCEGLNWNY